MPYNRKKYTKTKSIKGTVKWFDTTKGIGFLLSEEGSDIFVNYSDLPIKNGRFVSLEAGQKVEFDIDEGPRGPQAKNIIILA